MCVNILGNDKQTKNLVKKAQYYRTKILTDSQKIMTDRKAILIRRSVAYCTGNS